jgi:hypothetical protein
VASLLHPLALADVALQGTAARFARVALFAADEAARRSGAATKRMS